jgi:hypothetical protein
LLVGTTLGIAVQIGMLRVVRVPAWDDVRGFLRRVTSS